MNRRQHALIALLITTLFNFGCSRREERAASPPVTTPLPVAAPTPGDAEVSASAADVMAPLQSCQRACSAAANHTQSKGFVTCDRGDQKDRQRCRTKVLADTDSQRAACRHACEAKHGKPPGDGQ